MLYDLYFQGLISCRFCLNQVDFWAKDIIKANWIDLLPKHLLVLRIRDEKAEILICQVI
jgi:hypothetical protein